MKKCPFCKAEIEENARFCLYCMKSFDEKTVINPPKKRRWIWILPAVVLVVGIVLLSLGGQDSEDLPSATTAPSPTEDTTLQTEPPETSAVAEDSTKEPPEADTPSTENTTPTEASTEDTSETPQKNPPATTSPKEDPSSGEAPKDEPPKEDLATPCIHADSLTDLQEPTCTDPGFRVYTCKLCGERHRQTVAAVGHSYNDATCLLPQICNVCSQENGQPLGHSYSNGYCIRCKVPDFTNPKVVFSYREVAPDDFFPQDSITEGSVVITGVKEVSPDGEYEVPAYINGKPVVGIMSLAFSGSDARRVTLGENILRVNQNAFAGCFDIEVLRIKSKALFLSRSALIDAAHRSCKLTIYCAADCVVDDDLYGDCYLRDIVRVYGAEYQEL